MLNPQILSSTVAQQSASDRLKTKGLLIVQLTPRDCILEVVFVVTSA